MSNNNDEEIEKIEEESSSTENTKLTIQGLLKRVSEGKGFYHRKVKQDVPFVPQLSYDKRREIAESYAEEDTPLSERASSKAKKAERYQKLQEQIKKKKEKLKEEELDTPVQATEEVAASPPPPPPEKAPEPAEPKKSEKLIMYEKLGTFFEDLMEGYSDRYQSWENSVSNILAILRKMRKITKKNTEDLTSSINNLYGKITAGLNQFVTKRNEVEKVAEVDIDDMSGEFKKVLGLLECNVKEYRLKKEVDEYIHKKTLFS